MNVFDVLKEKINITDIVSKYLTLKRAGSYLKGRCPFHSEKTGSFTVSPEKGIFYCFGCHLGGDAIAFIAKIESCSQLEAAKIIAKDYNINLPESAESKAAQPWFNGRDEYSKICQLFEVWCHQTLLKNPAGLAYLASRGISLESIKLFKIGLCAGDLVFLKNFLEFCKKDAVLVQNLLDAKLLMKSSSRYYLPFEGRIIFPIKDYLGRLLGFGGRAFELADTKVKYYNSHDNQYFKKGSLLFGLDIAKKCIQEKGAVFLVEGYFDVVMMAQSGYKNTVATSGTACTQEQLAQIAHYADKVYITYDADKAGHNAVLRMVELCWNANLDLYVIKLPQGHDPASFLQENQEHRTQFARLIDQALDIFEFILESYGADFKRCSFSEKLKVTKKVLDLILNIQDNIKRHILLKRASELFDIPVHLLKNEVAHLNSTTDVVKKEPASESAKQLLSSEVSVKPSAEITLLEKNLFYVIIYHKGELDSEEEKFLIQFFGSPFKELLTKIHELKAITSDEASLFSRLSEDERNLVSSIIIGANDDKNTLNELLAQFYKKQWKVIVANSKLKISQAQQAGDGDLVKRLLGNLETLRNKILKRGGN